MQSNSCETNREIGAPKIDTRAEQLYKLHLTAVQTHTDRLLAPLMIGQWFFAIALALIVSPLAWEGSTSSIHTHVYLAIGHLISGKSMEIVTNFDSLVYLLKT